MTTRGAAPPRAIVWVSTFNERVQHAHFLGERFCSRTKVMDVRYWLGVEQQPKTRCVRCTSKLRRALG